MKMIYGVKDKPAIPQTILFALQQLLAILAATIAVPMVVQSTTGYTMYTSSALFGAGAGTLVYLLFTKFKSPVFLGSSFAFLGSMFAAFAGGVSASLGFLGLIIGAIFAGLIYVIIAVIVKFAGVKWIDKIMPAVVIGPTVAIIGLSLAGNAVGDLMKGNVMGTVTKWALEFTESGEATAVQVKTQVMLCSPYVALVCGLVTLITTVVCSVYGKRLMKMIPFILGIIAGYAVASIFTAIGYGANVDALKVINFELFKNMNWKFWEQYAFVQLFKGGFDAGEGGSIGAYIGAIAVAYIPVAFVVFAEHIADHKNISSIIETDLLSDPGLSRTLLGDGVGSMAGALFGGCPNTTYGESVGCVAISGNASIITIIVTAVMAIVASFFAPFITLLATIPSCVMGGVCIALYGFIAVSGLKMIQSVDLGDNRNLFVVSVILIAGVGGLTLVFGKVTVTEVACALILGIIVNVIVNIKKKKADKEEQMTISEVEETAEEEK